RPTAKASSTTAAPTSNDRRAPYTTRLHTSRPTSSVPNQCAAPGAVNRAETSMRSGSPAITGASAPITVVSVSSTRPMTVARRRTSRKSQSARRRPGSAGRGSARTRVLTEAGAARPARTAGGLPRAVADSLVPHPRIEDHVREVDGQIHEHVDDCDTDDDTLDDRVVAA